MKKNRGMIIVSILVLLSSLFTILSIVAGTSSTVVNIFIALTPIIVFYVQYLVENVDKCFLSWNKVIVWFKNPSIDWRYTAILKFDELPTNNLVESMFLKILSDESYKDYSKEVPTKESSSAIHYSFKIGITHIKTSYLNEDTIKITSSSKISYRDSKEEINDILKYVIAQLEEVTSRRIIEKDYVLKIVFAKANPFYGVYLKHVDIQSGFLFSLKYSFEGVNYQVSNRSIEASTKKDEKLRDITKNFLVLGGF